MVFGEKAQDVVVDRFCRGGDEQAPAAPQLGQQFGVIDEVLDLDGGIEGDVGECFVQRARQPEGMGGTIEEVRVAEGNMGCPFSDLLPDVCHHHVYRDDTELSLVHRDHRAVPAQVLAAPAALGKPGDAGRSVRQHQVGVAGELWQTTAVRHLERDPAQADDRLALGHCRSSRRIGPESPAKGNQRGLQLPAQHGAHAQSAQQRLIHGGVEPVDAEVGLRGESFDVGQGLHRDAGGGMHAHIKRHQARILQDFGIELLQRKIEAAHRKALALEPGGRLRQGKRLPPQLIGVNEDDLEEASRSKFCHGSDPSSNCRVARKRLARRNPNRKIIIQISGLPPPPCRAALAPPLLGVGVPWGLGLPQRSHRTRAIRHRARRPPGNKPGCRKRPGARP